MLSDRGWIASMILSVLQALSFVSQKRVFVDIYGLPCWGLDFGECSAPCKCGKSRRALSAGLVLCVQRGHSLARFCATSPDWFQWKIPVDWKSQPRHFEKRNQSERVHFIGQLIILVTSWQLRKLLFDSKIIKSIKIAPKFLFLVAFFREIFFYLILSF